MGTQLGPCEYKDKRNTHNTKIRNVRHNLIDFECCGIENIGNERKPLSDCHSLRQGYKLIQLLLAELALTAQTQQ